MAEMITSLIFLMVFVFIFLFSKLREFYRDKSLRELVAWSVSSDDHIRCNLSLSDYIVKAQIRLSLPQEHRVSGSVEMDYMKEILTEYQRDLSQTYFKGRLKLIKSKYAISGECYFMASLYAFLSEHQDDYKFLGHEMHKSNDFTEVYHKMHYITYMYCKGSDILKDYIPERS